MLLFLYCDEQTKDLQGSFQDLNKDGQRSCFVKIFSVSLLRSYEILHQCGFSQKTLDLSSSAIPLYHCYLISIKVDVN